MHLPACPGDLRDVQNIQCNHRREEAKRRQRSTKILLNKHERKRLSVPDGLKSEIREVDEPGPVVVTNPAPNVFICNLTCAKSAISRTKAIRVNNDAKNATKDEIMGMALWVENSEKMNAKNVTMVAAHKKNS